MKKVTILNIIKEICELQDAIFLNITKYIFTNLSYISLLNLYEFEPWAKGY